MAYPKSPDVEVLYVRVPRGTQRRLKRLAREWTRTHGVGKHSMSSVARALMIDALIRREQEDAERKAAAEQPT